MIKQYVTFAYPLSETFIDYPDPNDSAVIIYLLGCDHNIKCEDCHNNKFQENNRQERTMTLELTYALKFIRKEIEEKGTPSNKVVFSGGDPLSEKFNNRQFVKEFLDKYSKELDVCIYTGYDFEQIKDTNITGYKFIKCGKYIPALKQKSEKTDRYLMLASSNQKLYIDNGKQVSKNGIYYFKENH